MLALVGEKRNVIEGLLGRIMPMMSKVGLLVDDSSPTNMEQVYNILNSDERLSKNAVAAIMGNIDVETGGSFDFMQQQNKGPGYGLFQFEGIQRQEYDKFIKDNNLDDSAKSQIDYVMENIFGDKQNIVGQGNAKKIRDAFAGDVDTATEMFMTKFERPKDQSSKQINKRINKAKSIMDMFND